ncbi:MAG TPA: DUF4126 family protein [Blastocatellia bacterium]
MDLLPAFLIGLLTGLRSFTPTAITAWGAFAGRLKLVRPLALIGSLPAFIIFALLALGELVVDKLPKTPSRTAPPGLIARFILGGLAGACLAEAGGESALVGAVLAAVAAVVGAFVGHFLRTRSVKALGTRDLYVATVEDLIAIVGSFLVVTRF